MVSFCKIYALANDIHEKELKITKKFKRIHALDVSLLQKNKYFD